MCMCVDITYLDDLTWPPSSPIDPTLLYSTIHTAKRTLPEVPGGGGERGLRLR